MDVNLRRDSRVKYEYLSLSCFFSQKNPGWYGKTTVFHIFYICIMNKLLMLPALKTPSLCPKRAPHWAEAPSRVRASSPRPKAAGWGGPAWACWAARWSPPVSSPREAPWSSPWRSSPPSSQGGVGVPWKDERNTRDLWRCSEDWTMKLWSIPKK